MGKAVKFDGVEVYEQSGRKCRRWHMWYTEP